MWLRPLLMLSVSVNGPLRRDAYHDQLVFGPIGRDPGRARRVEAHQETVHGWLCQPQLAPAWTA